MDILHVINENDVQALRELLASGNLDSETLEYGLYVSIVNGNALMFELIYSNGTIDIDKALYKAVDYVQDWVYTGIDDYQYTPNRRAISSQEIAKFFDLAYKILVNYPLLISQDTVNELFITSVLAGNTVLVKYLVTSLVNDDTTIRSGIENARLNGYNDIAQYLERL